jgi:hypothetical protein
MQTVGRQIRHTICEGLLQDLDFVNCHPALLQQLARNKLPHILIPNLNR